MADKKEYVDVEGIMCEVKDPRRKATVIYYQANLRREIDNYVGNNRMIEKKRAYADALEINLKIAPFVLGWLRRPEDRDEYNVITGRLTLEELEQKRAKEAAKNKNTTRKKRAPKGLNNRATKGQKTTNTTTKKPVTNRKPDSKSGATKGPAKGSTTKKAAPKKTASKTTKSSSKKP